MGVRQRRHRDRERLKGKILRAARELFIRHGYENVSMRRVAQKIEYSPTTIYLYFKDKADLLQSVCDETFEGLNQKLEAILEEEPPLEGLKKGLRAYVDFGLENPHHYRVTFLMPYPPEERSEKYLAPDSPGMKAFSYLRLAVSASMDAGDLREVDVETASQALWAAVHGVTSILIVHPDFPWVERERLIASVIDSLVDGMRA